MKTRVKNVRNNRSGVFIMDINQICSSLENCPCGIEHKMDLKALYVDSGLLLQCGEILKKHHFPQRILLVSDQNELKAADGIIEILQNSGFCVKTKIYPDLRIAAIEDVELVEALMQDCDGVLSVGSGSCNDICRYSSYRQNKRFAIFATAPSMDGFASDSAPIITNGFKESKQARQPEIIIADTKILADAPVILKGAGFGDMVAKYIGLVDWKISHILSGEYYCPQVALLTKKGVDGIVALADKVTQKDEKTAGKIFESLVFTGIAMGFVHNSRPGSGAEHIISHFWEIKKMEMGKLSDFHGRKVGVATLILNRLYHKIAKIKEVNPQKENLDWNKIYEVYGKNLEKDIRSYNTPTTITDGIDPLKIKQHWPEICNIINETLPDDNVLYELMLKAGAATSIEEIDVDDALYRDGVIYQAYMRRRITLMRLIPMIFGNNFDYFS